MNNYTEADYGQMEAFLQKTLSDAEMAVFRQRLTQDPDLVEELNWFRKTMHQLRYLESYEAVNDVLKKPVVEPVPVVSTQNGSKVLPFAYAAAATLALIIGAYWFIKPDQQRIDPGLTKNIPKKEETSAEQPQNLVAIAREKSRIDPQLKTYPAQLASAVRAYQANNPTDALKQLRILSTKAQTATDSTGEPLFGAEPEDRKLAAYKHFYAGLSYLKKGAPGRALRELKKVKEPLLPESDWYKALCYLLLKQNSEAKKLLTEISKKPAHPFQNQATALLKDFK